jgi:hypothetical protein
VKYLKYLKNVKSTSSKFILWKPDKICIILTKLSKFSKKKIRFKMALESKMAIIFTDYKVSQAPSKSFLTCIQSINTFWQSDVMFVQRLLFIFQNCINIKYVIYFLRSIKKNLCFFRNFISHYIYTISRM